MRCNILQRRSLQHEKTQWLHELKGRQLRFVFGARFFLLWGGGALFGMAHVRSPKSNRVGQRHELSRTGFNITRRRGHKLIPIFGRAQEACMGVCNVNNKLRHKLFSPFRSGLSRRLWEERDPGLQSTPCCTR